MDEISDESGYIQHPLAFCNGKLSILFPGDSGSGAHIFGGEPPKYLNLPQKAKLNKLFDLDLENIPGVNNATAKGVPLVFPFKHDSGRVRYSYQSHDVVKILEVLPLESTDDWPYASFPESFEQKRFYTSSYREMSLGDFGAMLPQGLYKEYSNCLIVVIPPSKDFGVSLWGESGDAENVLCVFYIDIGKQIVYAENQCS